MIQRTSLPGKLGLKSVVNWLSRAQLFVHSAFDRCSIEGTPKELRMFSSQVLEVSGGLIFIYLVVSTVCSGIKELIARAFDMRAKTLETAIRNLLADPQGSITSTLIQNHLIAGTVEPGTKPAYISSRNFALALFDVIAPANPGQSRTVQDLKNGVSKLPDPRVSQAVLGLLDSGQQDIDLARQRVENWYDDAMERVSGGYKRRAQVVIALLGLGLCIGLNVDSLMIIRELWNDEALRTAVAAEAQKQADTPQAMDKCKDKDKDPMNCVTASIRAANMPPIGWARDGVRDARGSSGWLLKVLGILISSVAVAMGAPFWFDLLNKFVNLRLTGSPPPDSRQSASS